MLAGVDPDATVAQEEIFGPVLAVSTYNSEDEAIAIANNSIYGLNGAIFSRDVEKALALAGRIEDGHRRDQWRRRGLPLADRRGQGFAARPRGRTRGI